MEHSDTRTGTRELLASAVYGVSVGTIAGLIGLGGAELLIPFILYFLDAPLEDMIAANIIISLASSSVNFVLRARIGLFTGGSLELAAVMIIGSIFGAYAGASLSHRVSERGLKAFIAFILALVDLRILADVFFPASGQAFMSGSVALGVSVLLGLVIGIVSGSVGVAGGEYRIPTFTYLFGIPIKVAGTASQLVSIPTLLVALAKHAIQGSVSRRSIRIAAMLGTPTVAGVVIGSFLVAGAPDNVIRLLFASIITYSIVRLVAEVRVKHPASTLKNA